MSRPGENLSPEQWRRVKEAFAAALELAPADRTAYLDVACGDGGTAVRREVEALLAAHRTSDGFLDTPAGPTNAPPPHPALAEGQTLGPYRVVRTLGQGGMATVYLARDERHHRSVALKVLHADLAHALGADRFLREIEVAANLTHPHILPLHDSGEADGLLYYVMPYVEGESLRDRLNRETQLPVEEVLQVAREVADALAYAHGQGVIHRDIKPENILLSGGHALVADFGIARVLGQAGSASLTDAGMAIGTAAYMSPEQARAASHLDGRSDVYSLGCVVYEMLVGEPPYTGPTAQVIIAKRISDPVPRVRRVRSSVPEHVDRAVSQALATVPADRPATVAEFARALQPGPIGLPVPGAVPIEAGLPAAGRRRIPVAAMTLGLGMLIGLGVLFAWRRSQTGEATTEAKVLAVLPFENLGDTADAYFADGVANDLRTRLSQVAGLSVIARTSSNEYRQTKKPVQEIARELGVDYVLTATVQWEKVPGGASRVRVTPELVDVRAGQAPRTRWGQPFDAAMAGVFQVQADIAGRVAQALDVELSDSARRELAERPTRSLAAYDAFLRGEKLAQSLGASNMATLRQAVAYYAQAVALDSGFIQAWAQLSAAHSSLYFFGTPTSADADAARRAAERALALAPNRVEGHIAMSHYYRRVVKDQARALEELSRGERFAPQDPRLLASSAFIETNLGRWEAALTHLRQAHTLDPRSGPIAIALTRLLVQLRRYPEAREVGDRATALAPTNLAGILARTMIPLAQGDLAGARMVIANAPKEVDPAALVAYIATYADLYWALDDAEQRLLLSLRPSAFDDDRGTWGMVRAETFWLRNERDSARVYADSARLADEGLLRDSPQSAERRALYGLVLAYLGRKSEAVREGQRALASLPIGKDPYDGAYIQHQLARIYLLLGEPEKALDQLEPLLKMPYVLSPGWLRLDPNFDPLRGNPRFERLVADRQS